MSLRSRNTLQLSRLWSSIVAYSTFKTSAKGVNGQGRRWPDLVQGIRRVIIKVVWPAIDSPGILDFFHLLLPLCLPPGTTSNPHIGNQWEITPDYAGNDIVGISKFGIITIMLITIRIIIARIQIFKKNQLCNSFFQKSFWRKTNISEELRILFRKIRNYN